MTLDELKRLRALMNDASYATLAETCRVLLDREIEREAPLDGPFVKKWMPEMRTQGTAGYTATATMVPVDVPKTNQGGGGDVPLNTSEVARVEAPAASIPPTPVDSARTDSAASASFEERVQRLVEEVYTKHSTDDLIDHRGGREELAARCLKAEDANAAKDAEIVRLKSEGVEDLIRHRDEARDSACREADEFRATIKRLADERIALVKERDEAKRCLHVEMSMRHARDVDSEECEGPWRVVDGQDGAKAIRNDNTGQFWFNGYFQASIAVDVRNLLNQLASVAAARDALKAALDEERKACDEWRNTLPKLPSGLSIAAGFAGDWDRIRSHLVSVESLVRAHDARRDAEKQP